MHLEDTAMVLRNATGLEKGAMNPKAVGYNIPPTDSRYTARTALRSNTSVSVLRPIFAKSTPIDFFYVSNSLNNVLICGFYIRVIMDATE